MILILLSVSSISNCLLSYFSFSSLFSNLSCNSLIFSLNLEFLVVLYLVNCSSSFFTSLQYLPSILSSSDFNTLISLWYFMASASFLLVILSLNSLILCFSLESCSPSLLTSFLSISISNSSFLASFLLLE